MILYVNGDSHSLGQDAGGPDFSYGKFIADALGAKFICNAESACDNGSIIRRTKLYLETHTPDFIVIGWSTWEREEWVYDNTTYYVTSSGHDVLPKPLQNLVCPKCHFAYGHYVLHGKKYLRCRL